MTDPNQTIKDDMRKAIHDIFGDKDQFHRIDLDVASHVIITFIFANVDESTIGENNRFQFYYH